jgi:protease I
MGKLSNHKIVFLIAPQDFRDEEYFQPKVILQAEGAQIDTVTKGDLEEVTGSKGGKAHTNATLDDTTPQNYDALIIVGGPGVKTYFNDKKIHKIAANFYKSKKIIGAICSAPVILLNADLLKGKKVTSFEADRSTIEEAGIEWVDSSIVIDDSIVTAQGPRSAIEFGRAILKLLVEK